MEYTSNPCICTSKQLLKACAHYPKSINACKCMYLRTNGRFSKNSGGIGGTREIRYTQLRPRHFVRAYLSKNENNTHLSACFHPLSPMYFENYIPKRRRSPRVVTTIPRRFCCPQQGRKGKGWGQGSCPLTCFVRY